MCSVQCDFMSQLLEGKTALILGVANRWSLAYAIAQAFHREGDGSQVLINQFGPGDYFGEIGLLNDAPRAATVRAKSSLELMSLDRETFANLMKSSQATEDEVRRVAADRTRAAR